MQETIDFPELFGSFGHPGRAPAQRHLAVTPAFYVGRMVPANLDHRLDRVGRAQRAGQGGGYAQADDGEGLGQALSQRASGPGVGLGEVASEVLQLAWAARALSIR